MSRSSGTYTAPSSSINPAVEGTTIDEADFNALVDDLETALTESVYTAGMGSTDNRIVRTDGTDTKKVQGTGISVDDSDNVTGIAALTATTVNVGNADTTLSRSGAGDIAVEGNAIYRAGGTDVPIADGGTGQSTATAAFNALSPLTTQGDVLYHNGTNVVRLGAGTSGHFLKTLGAGANPEWAAAPGGGGPVVATDPIFDAKGDLAVGTGADTAARLAVGSNGQVLTADSAEATGVKWVTVAGTGDVTAASSFGTDNLIVRSDGTGKGVQSTGITVDDSNNVTGVVGLTATTVTATTSLPTTIELGHASDTTLSRSAAGEVAIEGVIVKKVGKETIFIPASAMIPRSTNGGATGNTELTTNKVMLRTLDFDTTTKEYCGFWVAMPKSWNESTVTFKAFWTAASGSGGVAWGLAAYSFSDDDAMDTAVSGQQVVTDTFIAANDMHVTAESSNITIGGTPAEGDATYFELTREVSNGSDTLGVDAKLIGIHIYFTTNASTDA